ncbi:MAG: SIS domain-containing protein, partial [Micromonosporaceae bacterium]
MCGIVAALPVYQRLSEEISLAELAELIPQLPLAIAEPGSDPEQMASALRGASDRLAAAIDAFAAPSAVKPLASCAEAADPVSAALDRLAGSVAALDAVFDQHAAEWEADVTEQAQRLLRDVKDQVWALRHDRVQAAVRSSELAGAEWNDRSVISYVAINSVLDALDRLEVRGRDSAGIAIWVRLAPEDRAQLRELSSRDDALLRNDSAVVAESGVGFVYKRAAIVGRLGDNTWFLRRSIMNDADLQQALNLPSAAVTVVSHTRWASVGRTSEANAHPVDNRHSDGGFTGPRSLVVLNGDVDNYLALQEECRYSSDDAGVTTDAKLLPLLLSKGLDEKQSSDQAMRSTLAACEGSMAIAAMCEDAPDEILLAVKGSGQSLYVGFAPSGYLVASEAYGLVGVTRRFARVEGQQQAGAAAAGSVVRLARDGAGAPEAVRRWDADGRSLPLREADVRLAEVTTHDLALGEYEHYLQKEIHEAASSFHKTLRGRIHQDADQKPYVSLPDSSLPSQLRDGLRDGKLRKLVIVGQGTAAVAGEGIAQMIELSVGDKVETHACPATEFSAWQLRPDMSDTLIVAVSQSGTTTDTNRAVDLARARGASVISIVNRRDSDLGEKSDGILYTSDGRDVELSVASTKAFYAQIAAGCLLGAEVAKELGCLTPARENSLLRGLARIPEQLRALHQADDRIAAVAGEVATRHPYWSVVGSGPNRVAADEVRIKASELCYMTISADAVEDKKHIDLSAEALVLVCVAGAPPHQVTDLIKEVEILNAHRNRAVVICDEGTEHLWPTESVIGVPQAHPELAWILAVAAGHLFSYHAARAIDAAAHPVRQALARLEAAVDEGSAVA